MSQKLKKTLEELASCSAWTFDEALLLLTGSKSHQIDYKKSHTTPPAPDIRYLLMLETREITWPIKEKQREGHQIYTEGNTEPVPTNLAEKFIKNGWAEDTESLAERKIRLKEEASQYQKAQGQFKLMGNLERAVLDNDIDTLNRTNQSPSSKWRMTKQSVLKWVNSDQTILQLRHFSKDIDDILVDRLLLSKATHPTTGQVVEGSTGENRQTKKAGASRRGRPRFPYSERFKEEVKKLHARNISKKDIPYRASITRLLNPEAINEGRVMYKDDYKKTYKYAYSTVYNYVSKAINE